MKEEISEAEYFALYVKGWYDGDKADKLSTACCETSQDGRGDARWKLTRASLTLLIYILSTRKLNLESIG